VTQEEVPELPNGSEHGFELSVIAFFKLVDVSDQFGIAGQ
jgi:hypothetical protein